MEGAVLVETVVGKAATVVAARWVEVAREAVEARGVATARERLAGMPATVLGMATGAAVVGGAAMAG